MGVDNGDAVEDSVGGPPLVREQARLSQKVRGTWESRDGEMVGLG